MALGLRAGSQLLPAVDWPIGSDLVLVAAVNHAAALQHARMMGCIAFEAFEIIGVDGGAGFDFDGVKLPTHGQHQVNLIAFGVAIEIQLGGFTGVESVFQRFDDHRVFK